MARIDCKADRKDSVLHVLQLFLEPDLKKSDATKSDAFFDALQKELRGFADFNGCRHVKLHRTTPAKLQSIASKAIDFIEGAS